MEGDEYVAGVVYEINGNEMFTAWKNGGAWLNGKQIHVSKAQNLLIVWWPQDFLTPISAFLKSLWIVFHVSAKYTWDKDGLGLLL